MSLLFETIKVENRRFYHLEWHNRRMNRSRKELLGINQPVDLSGELHIPETVDKQLYKCRVEYDMKIDKVEFIRYIPRSIKTLKVIHADSIKYHHKFSDRSLLDQLIKLKGHCDDILIIRNKYVTDTSYCNIAFFDGSRWVTPSTPLLKGTCRERLLQQKFLFEKPILWNEIDSFSHFILINAMMGPNIKKKLPVSMIER